MKVHHQRIEQMSTPVLKILHDIKSKNSAFKLSIFLQWILQGFETNDNLRGVRVMTWLIDNI